MTYSRRGSGSSGLGQIANYEAGNIRAQVELEQLKRDREQAKWDAYNRALSQIASGVGQVGGQLIDQDRYNKDYALKAKSAADEQAIREKSLGMAQAQEDRSAKKSARDTALEAFRNGLPGMAPDVVQTTASVPVDNADVARAPLSGPALHRIKSGAAELNPFGDYLSKNFEPNHAQVLATDAVDAKAKEVHDAHPEISVMEARGLIMDYAQKDLQEKADRKQAAEILKGSQRREDQKVQNDSAQVAELQKKTPSEIAENKSHAYYYNKAADAASVRADKVGSTSEDKTLKERQAAAEKDMARIGSELKGIRAEDLNKEALLAADEKAPHPIADHYKALLQQQAAAQKVLDAKSQDFYGVVDDNPIVPGNPFAAPKGMEAPPPPPAAIPMSKDGGKTVKPIPADQAEEAKAHGYVPV